MNELMLILCGVITGMCLGSWATWSVWLSKEAPKLNILVDREVLSTVTTQMAMDWAERRGLTWMPKGAVFNHNKAPAK